MHIESGEINWTVPEEQGAYPMFPDGASDDEKKRIISVMMNEHNRKVVEAVQDLLKNLVIEAINEDYTLK